MFWYNTNFCICCLLLKSMKHEKMMAYDNHKRVKVISQLIINSKSKQINSNRSNYLVFKKYFNDTRRRGKRKNVIISSPNFHIQKVKDWSTSLQATKRLLHSCSGRRDLQKQVNLIELRDMTQKKDSITKCHGDRLQMRSSKSHQRSD